MQCVTTDGDESAIVASDKACDLVSVGSMTGACFGVQSLSSSDSQKFCRILPCDCMDVILMTLQARVIK
jgi:hypothetical protein